MHRLNLNASVAVVIAIGCSACGATNAPPPMVSGHDRVSSSIDFAVGESKAWDSALDDARDAWSRTDDGSPSLAIRFEGESNGGIIFRDSSALTHLVPRASIDGKPIDGWRETWVSNEPDVLATHAVSAGRHTIVVEVDMTSEGSSDLKTVARTTSVIDVEPSRSVVVRAVFSSTAGRVELETLDTERVGIVEKAELDLGRIDADVRKLQTALGEGRRTSDAHGARCLNDKLSQALVAKRGADEARANVSLAAQTDGVDGASSIAAKITIARRRVDAITDEGRSCMMPLTGLFALAAP